MDGALTFKNGVTLNDVALGLVPGCELVRLRGYNPTLSTSIETVRNDGSAFNPLTTAASFEAVSSSTNDDAAGTGAQSIRVEFLDGNFDKVTVDVDMDGTSAVAISGTYLAVNSVEVLTVGSGLVNAGRIDVQVASGGTIHKSIIASTDITGVDHDFVYTVPANHKLLIVEGFITCSKNTDGANFFFLDYDLTGATTLAKALEPIGSIEVGAPDLMIDGPIVIDGQHRLDLRAFVDGGTTGLVRAGAKAVLVDMENDSNPFGL